MIRTCRDWARAVPELKGGRRNAVAFLFGICATLTLPPFFVFPLIIIAYGGLFLLVSHAEKPKRAFADGWWWGWGFYITGLYWFCMALLTDVKAFGWMLPFALFGVTAFVALYPALACLLFARLRVKGGIRRAILFSIVWTVIEYARGHLMTGFPWNIAGNSFAYSDISLQLASIFGAYGLTFWAVLLGVSFAALCDKSVSLSRGVGFIIVLWLGYAVGITYGIYRLALADMVPEEERYVPDVLLRLVQPNIAQPHKWDPARQMEGLHKHIHLTQSSGLSQVTHVIWPETGVPYVLRPDTPLLKMLGSAIPEDTVLITGALRAQGEGRNWQVWNSMIMLNHAGAVIGEYDKSKLVPFGEFLPFREWIPQSWLTPVGDTDFSKGGGPQTLEWSGLPPVRPMICYEVIFPEWAESGEKRPAFMLNITNDAWFGISSGPHQHFHMARMRAAEQGIPLIRVANTGISGVIDPYGRVVSYMPLGSQGIMDVKLPKPAGNTANNSYNYLFLFVLLLVGALLISI